MKQRYESRNGFTAGSSVVVVFQEETISLQLQLDGCLMPIEDVVEIRGWKMIPLSSLEVNKCSGDIFFILFVIIAHSGVQEGVDQHYSNPVSKPSSSTSGMDGRGEPQWETSGIGSESGSEGF